MNSNFKKYVVNLVLFSIVLWTIFYALFSYTFAEYYFGALPFIFIYFIVINTVTHYILLKSEKLRPTLFVNYFIGSLSFKMMASLGIIVVYCLFDKANAVPFILCFATLYFVYTIFEVLSLFKHFKSKPSTEARNTTEGQS